MYTHTHTHTHTYTHTHTHAPPTLQVVIPFLSPVTVHLKMKVSPGQVGGAAVNCAATSPGEILEQMEI